MYGHNTPRGQEKTADGQYQVFYQVREIFYTIQGEGPFAGKPATFIRLTGCNLRCYWCDTKWDDENDPKMGALEILDEVNRIANGCKLIVLTGGEPCRQDLSYLIGMADVGGYSVQVETAGSFWQKSLTSPNVTIVCSPKTAKVRKEFYEHCDHWKYVVSADDADETDGLPVAGTQRPMTGPETGFVPKGGPMARPPKHRPVEVYLQPCDVGDPEKNLANMKHMVKIAMKHGYRAGLQLHKIFGVE